MSQAGKARPSVLLVSVDALKPEFVFEQERLEVCLPNITRYFVEEGLTAREGMKSVFPTFTYPCHQSMITGTNPSVHGIVNNGIFDPTGEHLGAWHWFANRRVKTLWEAAKEAGYCSASVAFPTSVGAKGDYIAPEYWWDGSELDSRFIDAVACPQGLIGEMEQEIGRYAGGLDLSDAGDRQRGNAALWMLRQKLAPRREAGQPFFLSAYFASFDESAHQNGVYSREAAESLQKIDGMLGELIEEARRIAGEDLVVCVVSDHGSLDNTHNICPNVLLKEAGLIETDEKGAVIGWEAFSQRAGGTAEIRLHHPEDRAAAEKLAQVMEWMAQHPESGILEVLTGEEARERGGFPEAAYVLVSQKGYEIRDDVTGTYCRTSLTQKAQHGYSEEFPEMRASFMMTGAGIPSGSIEGVRLIDVAPTLAAVMGASLPDAQGSDVLGRKRLLQDMAGRIPAVADAAVLKETFWMNDRTVSWEETRVDAVKPEDIQDASERLQRFAPYLETVFPELEETGGIIESELREIPGMKDHLCRVWGAGMEGRLMLKMDSHLPVSGSVKARGGIYEVLKHAEDLALEAGLLKETDDYRILAKPELREFFGRYTVQVGSTGNLGMSIGIMSARLGFRVIVHMSADAKQWKKDLLRSRGVEVIEYQDDYCAAVEQGRKNSDKDPMSYFVDDENSKNLFLGYSVAGERLKAQLDEMGILVDEDHPLFVYLPCGIGGAPGGITYGLKQIYGDHVHCFFTEPTHACCMLLGMATGLHDGVSVKDFGIDGRTDADGLAVGRPSAFVGKVVEPMLAGIATIEDQKLYKLMRALLTEEEIFIEPSSCAAFAALIRPEDMRRYVQQKGLEGKMGQAVHIAWATGGSMVPQETRDGYLAVGR